MKLWLLKPHNAGEQPWSPWYDKAFGFVIAATNATVARKIASEHHGDESPDAWLDEDLSSCTEIKPDNYKGATIILRDFAST